MSSEIAPGSIDLVRRHFAGSSGRFSKHNAVFERIWERLEERLSLLAIAPSTVLDLGARNGFQLESLQQRYPDALIIGADPAMAGSALGLSDKIRRVWRKQSALKPPCLACDPHLLPLADESVDLVVSNLLLPWCHSPQLVFSEVARVLRPEGAFMFSSAGPDTLQEYRAIWSQIDSATHVYGLSDMHELGDAMLAAGFAAPVLDRENLIVDYPDIDALQNELLALGAANIAFGRRRGLMSPAVRSSLNAGAQKGRMPVTFELVQGHGWKGALKSMGNNTDDGYSVSVESLRSALRGREE